MSLQEGILTRPLRVWIAIRFTILKTGFLARLSTKDLPKHFSFAVDDSYPTCRLLNAPYTGSYETSQVYVLDGFIVSDNLKVSDISVVNTDFAYTDHQPVLLEVQFQ